jgi:hypothetical protein
MGLGDVSATTVRKVSLVAAPADGGAICTRTFIPRTARKLFDGTVFPRPY